MSVGARMSFLALDILVKTHGIRMALDNIPSFSYVALLAAQKTDLNKQLGGIYRKHTLYSRGGVLDTLINVSASSLDAGGVLPIFLMAGDNNGEGVIVVAPMCDGCFRFRVLVLNDEEEGCAAAAAASFCISARFVGVAPAEKSPFCSSFFEEVEEAPPAAIAVPGAIEGGEDDEDDIGITPNGETSNPIAASASSRCSGNVFLPARNSRYRDRVCRAQVASSLSSYDFGTVVWPNLVRKAVRASSRLNHIKSQLARAVPVKDPRVLASLSSCWGYQQKPSFSSMAFLVRG